MAWWRHTCNYTTRSLLAYVWFYKRCPSFHDMFVYYPNISVCRQILTQNGMSYSKCSYLIKYSVDMTHNHPARSAFISLWMWNSMHTVQVSNHLYSLLLAYSRRLCPQRAPTYRYIALTINDTIIRNTVKFVHTSHYSNYPIIIFSGINIVICLSVVM